MKKSKILLGIIVLLVAVLLTTACKVKESANEYDYLVLVNKYTQLPNDWEKNVKLVETKNAWDEDIKVEKEAFEQYKKFKEDVEKDLKKFKTTIELDSTYRSVKEQQELWDEWSKDPEKGPDYVKKFVAVPGYSEHHTGLAIDICLKKDGELVYDNDKMIAEKEIFSKIHAKLADYGFILRYPKDREDSTGYTYEPWHLRYIGDKDIAKEIMEKNITFEEYLDSVEDLDNNHSAAIYRIEKTLQEYFKGTYGDKIKSSRFNITKIYTKEEADKDDTLKDLKLGEKDLAFEVEYQVQPSNDKNIKELTVPDGEYNKELGWVTNIQRLGVLKYDSKTNKYSIKEFGTGW